MALKRYRHTCSKLERICDKLFIQRNSLNSREKVWKSVVAIHDKLICSGKAKALELDEDIYTVAKALGHPIVKW